LKDGQETALKIAQQVVQELLDLCGSHVEDCQQTDCIDMLIDTLRSVLHHHAVCLMLKDMHFAEKRL